MRCLENLSQKEFEFCHSLLISNLEVQDEKSTQVCLQLLVNLIKKIKAHEWNALTIKFN